jgi:hypothetical protein
MAVAVAAYTYDLGISSATADGRYLIFHREQCCNSCRHSDNLFVALNIMLRQRYNAKVRSCNHCVFVFHSTYLVQLLKSRDFLFYLMKGLEQLPPVSETVFRGIPACHLAMVRSKYLLGGDVHWSAFNSTSTDVDKAKRFAQGPVC